MADDIFEEISFTITEDIEVNAVLKLDPLAGLQSAKLTSKDDEKLPVNRPQLPPKPKHKPPKLPPHIKESTSSADESGNAEISVSEVSLNSALAKRPISFGEEEQKFGVDLRPLNELIAACNERHTSLEVTFIQQEVAFSRAEHLVERTQSGFEILVDSGICIR